jgi:hydrogenase maturation factor
LFGQSASLKWEEAKVFCVCVTRVAKVLSVIEGNAAVKFFDGRENGDVDVSVLEGVKKGAYVEVYGNLALSVLEVAEAKRRMEAWREVRRAAMLPSIRRGNPK